MQLESIEKPIEIVPQGSKLTSKGRSGVKMIQRTPLKKGTLKRQTKPKKKKTDEAKLKDKIWKLCKKIIRTKYGNSCYTCEAENLVGSNWHTGHFIPSSVCGVFLRWELRNLRPQCFRCNISLVGNGSTFYKRLVEREGQAYVDQLFIEKELGIKATKAFLSEKLAELQKTGDNL